MAAAMVAVVAATKQLVVKQKIHLHIIAYTQANTLCADNCMTRATTLSTR